MINNLVLSGGSISTIAIVGALSCLEDNGIISCKNINKFIGSSAGSIVSLLLCIGYEVKDIYLISEELTDDYNKNVTFSLDMLFNILDQYGLDDGIFIENWLKNILMKKINSSNPTFLEFAKITGKDLNVCASNISKYEFCVFSVDNTPNVNVVDAIRASISLPFIFKPKIINGEYYVDSGLLNNFPITHINSNKISSVNSLGICLLSDRSNCSKIENLLGFMANLVKTICNNNIINTPCIEETKMNIYEIYVKDELLNFDPNTFKFDVNDKIIQMYFKLGYTSVFESIKTNQGKVTTNT